MDSHWQSNGAYFRYASNKIDYLKARFSADDYVYNFAISDDRKDIGLLALFKEYRLI